MRACCCCTARPSASVTACQRRAYTHGLVGLGVASLEALNKLWRPAPCCTPCFPHPHPHPHARTHLAEDARVRGHLLHGGAHLVKVLGHGQLGVAVRVEQAVVGVELLAVVARELGADGVERDVERAAVGLQPAQQQRSSMHEHQSVKGPEGPQGARGGGGRRLLPAAKCRAGRRACALLAWATVGSAPLWQRPLPLPLPLRSEPGLPDDQAGRHRWDATSIRPLPAHRTGAHAHGQPLRRVFHAGARTWKCCTISPNPRCRPCRDRAPSHPIPPRVARPQTQPVRHPARVRARVHVRTAPRTPAGRP